MCPASTRLLPAPPGKDRTGLVVALLLLTLGVPEEVVVLDYAKSEVELKVCWLAGGMPRRPMCGVLLK
jgi:protein-tyrosine phosphatase